MNNDKNKIQEILRGSAVRKHWRRYVGVLSCIMVCVVFAIMTKPAYSMQEGEATAADASLLSISDTAETDTAIVEVEEASAADAEAVGLEVLDELGLSQDVLDSLEGEVIVKELEDGVKVYVIGNLPEGSDVKVTKVELEDATAMVGDMEAATPVFAYDVVIVDGEGAEWAPEALGVNVIFSGLDIPGDEIAVVKVDEEGVSEKVDSITEGTACIITPSNDIYLLDGSETAVPAEETVTEAEPETEAAPAAETAETAQPEETAAVQPEETAAELEITEVKIEPAQSEEAAVAGDSQAAGEVSEQPVESETQVSGN